jgi:hypothetical protein
MFLYTYVETVYDTIRNIITFSQLPKMINTYIIILYYSPSVLMSVITFQFTFTYLLIYSSLVMFLQLHHEPQVMSTHSFTL